MARVPEAEIMWLALSSQHSLRSSRQQNTGFQHVAVDSIGDSVTPSATSQPASTSNDRIIALNVLVCDWDCLPVGVPAPLVELAGISRAQREEQAVANRVFGQRSPPGFHRTSPSGLATRDRMNSRSESRLR